MAKKNAAYQSNNKKANKKANKAVNKTVNKEFNKEINKEKIIYVNGKPVRSVSIDDVILPVEDTMHFVGDENTDDDNAFKAFVEETKKAISESEMHSKTQDNMQDDTEDDIEDDIKDEIEDDDDFLDVDDDFDFFCEEPSLEKQIANWLKRTSFKRFVDAISKEVVGQENLKKILMAVYIYLENVVNDRQIQCNAILTAPSGSGKTETFRALRDYFSKQINDLPVCIVDMTSITSEGFKGNDTEEIVSTLIKAKTGVGIVFLDEFDKKLHPSYSGRGNDVNKEIQQQILTLLEGRTIKGINTEDTMFIALGSFDECREKRSEKKSSFGFLKDSEENKKEQHYEEITIDNIRDLGGIPELIGRFPFLVNYQPLTEEAINLIIDKNVKKISKILNANIVVGEKFRQHILDISNDEFGVRKIYNLIYSKAIDVMLDYMYKNEKGDLIINLDAFDNCSYEADMKLKQHVC